MSLKIFDPSNEGVSCLFYKQPCIKIKEGPVFQVLILRVYPFPFSWLDFRNFNLLSILDFHINQGHTIKKCRSIGFWAKHNPSKP